MYSNYKDEAEFRARYVKPLLNKMGFYSVYDLHGQNEFGKDSAVIGEVVDNHNGKAILKTGIGGKRIIDMLADEQLPRIC